MISLTSVHVNGYCSGVEEGGAVPSFGRLSVEVVLRLSGSSRGKASSRDGLEPNTQKFRSTCRVHRNLLADICGTAINQHVTAEISLSDGKL